MFERNPQLRSIVQPKTCNVQLGTIRRTSGDLTQMLSIFKYYMMLRSKVFSGGRTDTRTLMYSLKVRKSQKIFFLETPLPKKQTKSFEGFLPQCLKWVKSIEISLASKMGQIKKMTPISMYTNWRVFNIQGRRNVFYHGED